MYMIPTVIGVIGAHSSYCVQERPDQPIKHGNYHYYEVIVFVLLCVHNSIVHESVQLDVKLLWIWNQTETFQFVQQWN